MQPSKLLITSCLILFLLGLGGSFFSQLSVLCALTGGLLVGIAVADFCLSYRKSNVLFKRDYQSRFALGESTQVSGTVSNQNTAKTTVRIFDGIPNDCTYNGFPFQFTIKSGEFATYNTQLTFRRRGDHIFEEAYIQTKSPLGLWWHTARIGEKLSVQVFPNYKPALKYGLLATSDRVEQMGIIKKRHRGASKTFHQLRDYQDGDPLNMIDWKATSRARKLISREYQEERDQNILLIADCSMRTKAIDQELPILDHLLNAMILVSYMALQQGDKVSMMNFGTPPQDQRFLAPVKGNTGISAILSHLYNYQSSDSYGDYSNLSKTILSQTRKRSLIIILTNLRSEDQFGCAEALKLLSQKHLVLLASVKESSVTQIIDSPIYNTKDASEYLGAQAYEQDAQDIITALSNQGVSVLRSSVDGFGIQLANRYLDLRPEISG